MSFIQFQRIKFKELIKESIKIIKQKEFIVISLILIIFIVKLLFVLSYKDQDWEPDSFMHFLQVKSVYQNFPYNLNLGFGVWSKPLYTYIFGFFSLLFNIKHLFGIQLINIILFGIISYVVYKIVIKFYENFGLGILSIILELLRNKKEGIAQCCVN